MSVQDYRNSIRAEVHQDRDHLGPRDRAGRELLERGDFVDVNDAVAFFQAGSVPLVDTATALTLANYAGLTQGCS